MKSEICSTATALITVLYDAIKVKAIVLQSNVKIPVRKYVYYVQLPASCKTFLERYHLGIAKAANFTLVFLGKYKVLFLCIVSSFKIVMLVKRKSNRKQRPSDHEPHPLVLQNAYETLENITHQKMLLPKC